MVGPAEIVASLAAWAVDTHIGPVLPIQGEGHDVVSLQERAGEAGLGLSDGRGFFPNPDAGTRFQRIPFCSLTPEEIREAISRLGKLLHE